MDDRTGVTQGSFGARGTNRERSPGQHPVTSLAAVRRRDHRLDGAAPGSNQVRILLVAPPWFPVPPTRYGGTELVVATLAEGLAARGFDVTVATTADSTVQCARWETLDRAPTAHLGDQGHEVAHALAAHGRADDFDLVHDHTLIGTAIASLARPSVPVVHTLHGKWTDGLATACRALAGRCDLVAISHDQAARAPQDVAVTQVIHHGLDLSRYPVRTAAGSHLAFLGRASPEKAPHLAVDVARRLGRSLVMGIKVNEPVERAYWRDHLEPRIAGRDDVTIIENADHEQKLEILRGASALLFPIQWPEPFGLVPLEANACGTPVVAFADGAVPEVVAHGRSGVLVEPAGGVEALAAAVPQAEALARQDCRTHVEDHFTHDRMVEDHVRLYLQVLARELGHPSAVEHRALGHSAWPPDRPRSRARPQRQEGWTG